MLTRLLAQAPCGLFGSEDRGSQLSLSLVGEVIIDFLGICGGYYSISE